MMNGCGNNQFVILSQQSEKIVTQAAVFDSFVGCVFLERDASGRRRRPLKRQSPPATLKSVVCQLATCATTTSDNVIKVKLQVLNV